MILHSPEYTEATTMFPTLPPTGKTSDDDLTPDQRAERLAWSLFAPDPETESPETLEEYRRQCQQGAEDANITRRFEAMMICAVPLVVLVLCGVKDLRLLLPLAGVMIAAAFWRGR